MRIENGASSTSATVLKLTWATEVLQCVYRTDLEVTLLKMIIK